ncbi:aminomethyl transferase family protein [Streptomyces sp. JV176]|uniref:aminomethyl transferase family protein n=1 Tax=Streptomyces sp. JV176 TaxID=858630 RepID=UPI002E775B34|nr:aminomethyl transferase family protein [Streptomyces sp. JV176]MEE1801200.1 aminomethyl transferase family protein [Streptomyces sp. JV176]
MTAPSLQNGIDRAGSPVKLLWKPDPAPWTPEVIEPEYVGWRQEQAAWHTGVALSDLSHHMSDTRVEGPDATRLLAAVSANDYERFAVGQAKQFVPVAPDGNLVTDGILLRDAEHTYTLSGIPAAQSWVKYHARKGAYDVTFVTDPSSAFRNGGDPTLFRYQIQGPLAGALVEEVFGGPIPPTKFFHSTPVSLGPMRFRALRHGMAGRPGFEFVGPWQHAKAVKEALMTGGGPFGLVHVGALAYPTASMESGWIATPTPAVYTDPDLADYRAYLPLYGVEGQKPLHGSFFSENIEDFYCSPYELGYGKAISFDHDFIGREALRAARDSVRRTKVTLVLDAEDLRNTLGQEPGFVHTYARNRVETGSALAGVTFQSDSLDRAGTVLSLALVDHEYAEPGTEVSVVWGDHPGPGTDPGAHLGLPRIRATVHPAPYDDHARTRYRRNA